MYESDWRTPLPPSGTNNTYPTRIGTTSGVDLVLILENTVTNAGWIPGDQIVNPDGGYYWRSAYWNTSLEGGHTIFGTVWTITNKGAAAETTFTVTSWKYKFMAKRRW
jgi:hypothetical protein